MLTDINPKLPMRDKDTTRDFYLDKLGFQEFCTGDHTGYLMVEKEKNFTLQIRTGTSLLF